MKRTLIFDFGGVLMKTVDYMPRITWDDKLGLQHGSVERVVHGSESWILAQKGEIPIEDYWQDVADQLDISTMQVEQLARDFYSGDQLDESVVDYIKSKKIEGFTVALLSNDSVELRPKLETLQLDTLFDPLIISAEIGVIKPHGDAYQAVLSRLNRPAEETIFIDDRLENVEGANALGIVGIHYHSDMDLQITLQPLLVL